VWRGDDGGDGEIILLNRALKLERDFSKRIQHDSG
jgi:hypothetical protein